MVPALRFDQTRLRAHRAHRTGRDDHGGDALMRINTNIMALNAYNNLENTSNEPLEQPREALLGLPDQQGRGRRVGPRDQREPEVAGLGSPAGDSMNAQDGISVVQTAEGALSSVQSMLQRIRDLVIESANTGGERLDGAPGGAERDRPAPQRDRPRGEHHVVRQRAPPRRQLRRPSGARVEDHARARRGSHGRHSRPAPPSTSPSTPARPRASPSRSP